ncbi:MAG: hypothetical protein K6G51_06875 [Sphaerochaetaceae bacterium]|nr:hypothetical protein [Sphaerochaetaceae bacterium]
MKKYLSILLLLFLTSSLFAISHLQFGPSATANYELNGSSDLQKTLGDINNYTFGIDTRLTIKRFQLTGLGEVKVTDDLTTFNTNISLNYLFNYAKVLNLAIGLGPKCKIQTSDWKEWKVLGKNGDEIGFLDALKESNITYRIGADISLLGLGVSVAYYVPAEASFANIGASWLPNFDKGSISFSLLFGIL